MNKMKESTLQATVGGLLHDIGKVTYRLGKDRRNHSALGYDALCGLVPDETMLDCVRYHHADRMQDIDIPRDAPAYAVYIADNIASRADRRDISDDAARGYDQTMPLASVFGTMLGKMNELVYPAASFREDRVICPKPKNQVKVDKDTFQNYISKIYLGLLDNLRKVSFTCEGINAVMSVMQHYCGFLPSDTAVSHVQDISLYDHLKLTAAFAACINEYCIARGISDYRKTLFRNEKDFWSEKAFLLFSADISGIQSFIYNISSKGAMKSLRSRSFWLEMLMEHFIDEILSGCGLSRANLIYSGGGHCYILLPNTEEVREVCDSFGKKFNHWLMEHFGISLYMAYDWQECSANDLTNTPTAGEKTPYGDVFIKLSRKLSQKKMHRYSAEEIMLLNRHKCDSERECKICGRSDNLTNGDNCRMCQHFIDMGNLINKPDLIISVTPDKPSVNAVTMDLPSVDGSVSINFFRGNLDEYLSESTNVIRVYVKNRALETRSGTCNIFMGDYVYDPDDPDIAKLAEGNGIKRLSVCRADVDNLGKAFISGFEQKDAKSKEERYRYVTISRTAAFSRLMSLFFRYYINLILTEKHYRLNIVYSGGDDVFLIGNWSAVIEASAAIRDKFTEYCGGALTISAGIGIFSAKYPVAMEARSTAGLEEKAKQYVDPQGQEKNAVCLFTPQDGYTFGWDEWKNDVTGVKLALLKRFFDYKKDHSDSKKPDLDSELHGWSMLYRILGLLRQTDDKINIARYAYMLARLAPEKKADEEYKKIYQSFSEKMYQWILDENERKRLMLAIMIYVYTVRNNENNQEEDQQ